MLAFFSNLSYRSRLLLALLAGVLNVLAFAPFHLWPLQVLGVTLMLVLVFSSAELSLRRVFILGWCYAFGWLYAGVCWLLIALTRYGGMPLALSIVALALLVAYMALYVGLAFMLSVLIQRRWHLSLTPVLLVVFPSLWCWAEYLRAWVFTGFPWLSSGYAHNVSPLAGFAPLLGVYGIGALSALLAAALALTVLSKTSWHRMMMLIVTLMAGGVGLQHIAWTHAVGSPISVRLLQGNVAQDMKFDADHLNDSLHLYHDMILQAPANLIATPETALPVLTSQLPSDYLPRINQFAQESGSHVVLGVAVHDGDNRYSNSVLGFSRQHANQAYRYDKHHLVPFGEFIPYGFRWFVNLMQIPLGDFSSAGIAQAPMQVGDQWVLPNICYEDLFGEEIAQQLRQQTAIQANQTQANTANQVATILLNTSNIAWYGDSLAIPQHLQISQMRALETGRPMLRATNTGATAVIDAHGQVTAQLQPLTRATLSTQVQGMSGLTPYVRMGNWGVLLLCIFNVLVTFFWVRCGEIIHG